MRNWKRKLILYGAIISGLGILYVIFNFVFLNFIVDIWWFRSLDYDGYFLLRLLYRYLVFFGATFIFFLIFFLNFWVASRYLGTTLSSAENTDSEKKLKKRNLIRLFQSGSLKIYTLLSVILAVLLAIPLYEQWESALLYIFGSASGVYDPVYGKDISYYLFSFPVYTLIQSRLLITFLVLFAGIFLLYQIEKRILSKEDKHLPRGSRVHLIILAGFIILIQAWDFYLKRYYLLYTSSHQPVFFGPGFIEMRYDLPLIWLALLLFIGTTVLFIIFFLKKKGLKVLILFGTCFLLSMWLRETTLLSGLIDNYIVKPNPQKREKLFIANNIKATLAALNLNNVEYLEYPISPVTKNIITQDIKDSLHNIPVWDRSVLDDVYTQFQGIRPYYNFSEVDVDRYNVAGYYHQVYLAARELNLSNLPRSAQNWENSHLQYTHGYGIVMTPAAQGGDEPLTWFVKGLNMDSEYGFSITRPEIYYGMGPYNYCIVPNDLAEVGHSKSGDSNLKHYQGNGGVSLSSLFRELMFSVYYKDAKIFFTTSTNAKSRMLFRRNIKERIHTITPYFFLDEDPYIVATSKGLFWMVDAYTTSDRYPNVENCHTPFSGGTGDYGKQFNYIRNSVKIVVDAYNGDTTYYMADTKDPIIRAYNRIYPGLLKRMDQMPPELKAHIRYPKYIFEVQMSTYTKFHQTAPEMFYQQEDTWEFAKINSVPMKPYYLTTAFPGSDKQEFLLVSPMSPAGRDNLRALAVAGCDGNNYGKIVIFNFSKEKQVSGPSQINALIAQNATISQNLTLWGQGGSKVQLGRMIILPTGKTILYIQPLYLVSTAGTKIPELKRIIVSQGNVVAMESSLEAAVLKIDTKLQKMIKRMENRYKALSNRPRTTTPQEKKQQKEDTDLDTEKKQDKKTDLPKK